MNNISSKQDSSVGKFTINMFFLVFYVFTSYVAQEGLLPTFLNSLALYAFIGVSFLNLCYNFKDMKLPNFTIWYALMFVLAALSFLYSRYVTTSALYTMFVALVLSFCFITTVTDFNKVDMLARTYIWSSVLMSTILWATDKLILNVEEGERLGENLELNPNAFSNLISAAAILAAWFMVYRCKWNTRWIYILAFGLLIFVMALSGGRANVVVVIACALVFIFFYSGKKHTPIVRNIFICLLLLLAAYWAIMNIPLLYDAIGERFEAFFANLLGIETDANSVHSDATRATLIKLGLRGWIESPLFGHGLDSFKYFNASQNGHFYYAHNNYVELLYDLGLVGFIAYYSMYFYLFVKVLKISRDFLKYKILGVGLLAQFVISDFADISFYTSFSITLLAIIYAIIRIAANQKEKQGVEETSNE